MLDMGFEPEVRKIVSEFGMPAVGERQTLMFSATFPEEIQKLASKWNGKLVAWCPALSLSLCPSLLPPFPPLSFPLLLDEFLNDYLFLTIGVVGGTTSDIDQSIIEVGEFEKKEKLQEILTSTGTGEKKGKGGGDGMSAPSQLLDSVCTCLPLAPVLPQVLTGLLCLWRR